MTPKGGSSPQIPLPTNDGFSTHHITFLKYIRDVSDLHLYGLDFTSKPRRAKPVTCVYARLSGDTLHIEQLEPLIDFSAFESLLSRSGPWTMGIDAPLAQPRRLVEALGWSPIWSEYVEEVAALGKEGFEKTLKDYMAARPKGDKLHRREVDSLANAVSPMALSYVPVGKMFFELAPRLLRTDLNVPLLRETAADRTVLEVYPALVTRQIIGKRKYKSDTKQKQTEGMREARQEVIEALNSGVYGLRLELGDVLSAYLLDDATGDALDATLCAVQTAWALKQENYGMPGGVDGLEGWIADPTLKPTLDSGISAKETAKKAA